MLKRILQNFVVRTNFWPFSWAYRIYYACAINIIAYVLGRQRGIVSVYLIAGMAAGEYIYGLSDIDLIVIFEDNAESKERIDRLYEKLSRLIPVLKNDERSIYGIKEIRRSYKQGGAFSLKYKVFTECKKKGRLLCGIDILRDFKELDARQRNEFVLGQLGFIWSIFLKNFLMKDKISDALTRNYFCYKLTSDSCKAFISASNKREIFNRREALKCAEGYLDEEQNAHIKKIKGLFKKRFNVNEPRILPDTCNFCLSMAEKTIEHMPSINECDNDQDAGSRAHFDFEHLDFIISDANKRKMDTLVNLARKSHKEYIQSMLVSPFDLLHLDEQDIAVFIIQKRVIPFEIIKEFNSIIGAEASSQRFYAYILTPEVVISLNRFDPFQSAISPLGWIEATSLYLSTPFSVLFGQPLQYNKSRGIATKYKFREMLARDRIIIPNLINSGDIMRLSVVMFQILFWQAMRLKLIEATGALERAFFPLSSKQVCRSCKDVRGFDFPWLEAFHEEYKKDLNGFPSDSEAYFPEAIAVLRNIYGINAEVSHSAFISLENGQAYG